MGGGKLPPGEGNQNAVIRQGMRFLQRDYRLFLLWSLFRLLLFGLLFFDFHFSHPFTSSSFSEFMRPQNLIRLTPVNPYPILDPSKIPLACEQDGGIKAPCSTNISPREDLMIHSRAKFQELLNVLPQPRL